MSALAHLRSPFLAALAAWPALATASGATASSELNSPDGTMSADLAVDGLFGTGWASGDAGTGKGAWLELDIGTPRKLDGVSLWPGNLKTGSRSYREYSRPKDLHLVIDGTQVGGTIHLQDQVQRVDIPLHGATGRKIRFVIDDVYEGIVYPDLYIAEVAVDYPMLDDKGAYLTRWLDSALVRKMAADFVQRVEDAYAAVKQKGDDAHDSFVFLGEAAAEGPPYLRKQVQKSVPAGWRAQAIRSSDKAREALRKLKNPNAIPYLELAALRATGKEQQKRQSVVDYFRAYQDLLGGGSLNVPAWGRTGWSKGALQSFGEPLPIAIDRFGKLYVADTGNNRIQRFDSQGLVDKQWGPPPDITDVWFQEGRVWYVSGAKPGEGPGEFMNPLDVELIPQRDADWFAVLDAANRIQVFNAEGQQVISWKVQTQNHPEPKLGGEAYLAWVPKKKRLYAIIEDEAVGYTLDSEEVARFDIPDGTPNAVDVARNGKLLFAYGDQVVEYALDGFRDGVVIGAHPPGKAGVLGRGFEDLDITHDEKGDIWILTDRGDVFVFQKPGKLEYSLKVVDRPLTHPRIAVREGILFYSSDDRIEQVDVLQAKLDQAQAAASDGGDAR